MSRFTDRFKTRLYYPSANKPRSASGAEDYAQVVGNAVEKIVKLIPLEVVLVYNAAMYFASSVAHESWRIWLYRVAFVAGLIATAIYLYKAADHQKPYKTQIALSTIAFVFWAYLTTGKELVPQWYDSAAGICGVLIYSLVAGCVPITK